MAIVSIETVSNPLHTDEGKIAFYQVPFHKTLATEEIEILLNAKLWHVTQHNVLTVGPLLQAYFGTDLWRTVEARFSLKFL